MPAGWAGGRLRALLDAAAAPDHGPDHQGLLLALRPARKPVDVIAGPSSARQLARPALADGGKLRTLEDRLGGALLRRDAAEPIDHGFDLGLGRVHPAGGLRRDLLDHLAVLVLDLLADVRGDEGPAVVNG